MCYWRREVGDLNTLTQRLGRRVSGILTRSNTDIALPVIVGLTSSDVTEATVPTTVTIPANQTSVEFVISAVDDDLLDGTQTVTITATASGYANGQSAIDITDAERLALTFTLSTISEKDGRTQGIVRRGNTDVALSVTTVLVSSDITEATVTDTVTMLANESEVAFTVNVVNDLQVDGNQSVQIVASHLGYEPASSGSILVSDDD